MCRETEKIGRCAFFLFNRLRLADKYMRAGFVRLWSSGSYFITAKAIPKSASRSQSPVIPLVQPLYERETVTVHGNTHVSISPHVRARHTAPALLANRHSPPPGGAERCSNASVGTAQTPLAAPAYNKGMRAPPLEEVLSNECG